MKLRFLVITALAALVGALVLVAPAAAIANSPSTITIQRDQFGFPGVVSNPGPPACQSNRLVSVHRRNGSNNQFLGSDHTNATGFWSVEATVHHGTYFAVVHRRVLPSRNVVCQAAVSRAITVD